MSAGKRFLSPIKLDSKENKRIKMNCIDVSLKEKKNIGTDYQNYFDDDDVFDSITTEEENTKQSLDLSKWTRCIVNHFERDRLTFDLLLKLHDDNELSADCRLQGAWSNTNVSSGDIISVQAVWDDSLKSFKVDNKNGFCVLHSDYLISGTTVVGSLFCKRKTVLQEHFRGIDGNNKVMVIGSLVHNLLQYVLTKKLYTSDEINSACTHLIENQETAFMLYESCLKREEVESDVKHFVPHILKFVQQYILDCNKTAVHNGNFQGKIDEIMDIEENLWVPQLGLKGKVDVSVRLKKPTAKILPLELKTGRASFSMEHKGQILLYQIMLDALGQKTTGGLLLYLREGIMRELSGQRNEQRDLIMLRNELSYYLFQKTPQDTENYIKLPEPISHPTACNNCAYASICCMFAQNDPQLQLAKNHPLQTVMNNVTHHLTALDYEYFFKWFRLIKMEEEETSSSNFISALWTQTSEARYQQGRALIDLQLEKNSVVADHSRFLHAFTCQSNKENNKDFKSSGFAKGEYVIVSSSKQLAIAAGCIHDISCSEIVVSLERNLNDRYANQQFIIDKHESRGNQVFNYTNLGLLMDNTEHATTLRQIVIQRKPPTYGKVLPRRLATDGAQILQELNAEKRTAILRALTTESYMLIKGLPGTGKTQTLVALVRLLEMLGKSVLITSHTNSAVDNLLLRLLPHGIKPLRLGSAERTHAELRDYCENVLVQKCTSEIELSQCYASYNVVGVTCLGANHSIFLHRKFDYCIVDEAAQVLQSTILRPLFFATKFVLVGDPDQLPPLVRSRKARLNGADVSLFHHLDTSAATSVLGLQYRMNKTITKLANYLSYKGALQAATSSIANATIDINLLKNCEKWLQRALHAHIDQAVIVLDTLNCEQRSTTFISEISKEQNKKRLNKNINYCEAAVIFHIVRALLAAGYNASRIGIIAAYRAQVELLQKLKNLSILQYKELNFDAIEVNTVDQYQGRDKDIILFSGARTGLNETTSKVNERARETEILEDKRRLTVAITRAKYKLIVVGDIKCLLQYTPFEQLFSHIPSQCKIQLEDGKLDFNWTVLLDGLQKIF